MDKNRRQISRGAPPIALSWDPVYPKWYPGQEHWVGFTGPTKVDDGPSQPLQSGTVDMGARQYLREATFASTLSTKVFTGPHEPLQKDYSGHWLWAYFTGSPTKSFHGACLDRVKCGTLCKGPASSKFGVFY